MVEQRRPSGGARTELRRTLRPEETEIPVLGHAAFAPRGRLQIGAERVRYDGVADGFFLNCARGIDREEGGSEPRRWPGGTPVTQVEDLAANIDPVAVEPTEADVGVIRHVDNGAGYWDAFNVVVHAPDRSLQTVALNLLQTGRDAAISFALKWGVFGSGPGQFQFPGGVAVDGLDGRVFVADAGNNRVQCFSADGAYLGGFGSFGSGNGQFRAPAAVAVNQSTRDVYVADFDNHRVQRFNASWSYVGQFGGLGSESGKLDRPAGVAVDAAGNVWVTDTGNDRVQKFGPAGAYLAGFGAAGSAAGQLSQPRGIAIDPGGNVWVADSLNHRVQKFDAGGGWLQTIGRYGNADGQFNQPYAVAVDAGGGLYVADNRNHRVQRFAPDGTFLAKVGDYGSGDGQFNQPFGIALAPAGGALYVADFFNHRVQKFRVGSDGQVQFLSGGQSASDPDLFWDAAAKRLKAGVESGLARLAGGVLRRAAVSQRSANRVIANNTDGDWTASCLPGEVVVGGGCYNGGAAGTLTWGSFPSGQGWRCIVRNTTGVQVTATAYAICVEA